MIPPQIPAAEDRLVCLYKGCVCNDLINYIIIINLSIRFGTDLC